MGVGFATLQSLDLPELDRLAPFSIDVWVGGSRRTLDLRPHDMRAPGFEVLLRTETGLRAIDVSTPWTFRGTVDGGGKSCVAATIDDGKLHAIFEVEGELWGIQPDTTPGATARQHVTYPESQLASLPFECATSATSKPGGSGGFLCPGNSAPYRAELAIEIDAQYLARFSNNPDRVVADVWKVLNPVDLIFLRDVGIFYAVESIVIDTVDPYPGLTDPVDLLVAMQGRWSSELAHIHRDVAHLFTGRELDGNAIGIAFLDAICTPWDCGISQTLFHPNLVRRSWLTAHELGHNWGADHCEGPECRIMCPVIGACSGDGTGFADVAKGSISSYRDSVRTCLDGLAGDETDGGGIAFTNLDGDPALEIVLASYEDQPGTDLFRYLVGYNVNGASTPTDGWQMYSLPGVGTDSRGADVAIGAIDDDPRPDLVVMAYEVSGPAPEFRYQIHWNLNATGVPSGSSPIYTAPGSFSVAQGAGLAISDIDGDPRPDLVLMVYVVPDYAGGQQFHYRYLWNLDTQGVAAATSPLHTVPGFVAGEGAGVTVHSVDGDPRLDMTLVLYGDQQQSSTEREFLARMLFNLDPAGVPNSTATWTDCGIGFAGGGAGIRAPHPVGFLPILLAIEDLPGGNQFHWRGQYY
ncbi:MAG: hypothetical protein GY711_13785 [bacterium]|nr:hypothetical protein [bacterium]